MTDPVSIGALLSSIKTATDIAKFFRDADINLQKAETKAKIADLISALAEMKMQTADLREAILERDSNIRELEAKLKIQHELRFVRPHYWLVDDQKEKDGPFCSHCKDKDDKLIRLQSFRPGSWSCSVCRNSFSERDSTETGGRPNMNGWT